MVSIDVIECKNYLNNIQQISCRNLPNRAESRADAAVTGGHLHAVPTGGTLVQRSAAAVVSALVAETPGAAQHLRGLSEATADRAQQHRAGDGRSAAVDGK